MLALVVPVRADAPLADFLDAWAKVDSYTATIAVHEIDGRNVQDRVYRYAYKKPHFARIDIVEGPGRGGGAVWSGGDRVKGHQGGILAMIKLSVAIDDPRATSLRGDTIEHGSFQSVADDAKTARTESGPAASVNGLACDTVTFVLAAPDRGVTRRSVCFARTTHMPVRRSAYAGDTAVKQEDFRDLKLDAGLKESDFG